MILTKPSSEWDEDEQKQVKEAVEGFVEASKELFAKHGMTYSATLNYTPNGVIPVLNVIPYDSSKE